MKEQPEALWLADAMTRALQQTDAEDDVIYVARWFVEDSRAELRRLHAENERLHQINQSHEMKLSVRGYELQIEDLKAANAELLEVLKPCLDWMESLRASGDVGYWEWKNDEYTAARAAIAKAEGEKE
jgi:hypothetical protein